MTGRLVADWDPDDDPATDIGSASSHLRLNDTDNSTRLIDLHGDRLRFVTKWGAWIVWDGTRWIVDRNRVAITELAKDVSRVLYREASETRDPDTAKKLGRWADQSATRGRISSMIELARGIDGVAISHDELDADPWLFGVTNGYIDLRKGTYHPPDPDKLMTMQASVAYDPGAEAPRWEQALREWFPDEEVRRFVQRLSGHALSGDPRSDHIFVIHHGDGRNGKGTFMRAHKHVLGPYYVTPDKSLLVQKRHEQHPTVKARLYGARLAVASETEHRERLNEAQVKNLTGRDPINARRMREDEWEFEPTHSFWLQTNYLPEISGSDTGIWSRIKVVPWTETFTNGGDGDLDVTLAGEVSGILNWMIAGCLDWQAEGLSDPDAVIRATLDYRATEDVLTRFATDTGIQFARSHTVVDAELKARIGQWATDEGVDKPDAKKINTWMKANGCREGRENYTKDDGKTSKRKIWKGARFQRPNDASSERSETVTTVEETPQRDAVDPLFRLTSQDPLT
jgi:putative DNA primase/helicase